MKHILSMPEYETPLRAALIAAALVALVGLMLGCDDDPKVNGNDTDAVLQDLGDSSGDDLPEGDTPIETCAEDSECEGNLICDAASSLCAARCTFSSCPQGACDMSTGHCIDGTSCTEFGDCGDATIGCNTCKGLCEPLEGKRRCEDATNCFTDEYCHPCKHRCEPNKALCDECIFHYECGTRDDLCIDIISAGGRFCGTSCQTLIDCPDGYTCVDISDTERQCVPASGSCGTPFECEADLDCQGGPNQICRNKRCVPGCTTGGCSTNTVCDHGNCQLPCDLRGEPCAAPTLCDAVSGVCKLEGQCESSRDCPDAETHCDLTTNQCAPGCEVDNDCLDATKECVSAACVPLGCKGAWSCGFGQLCDMSSAVCGAAPGPHCEAGCDPEAEAPCGPAENKCLSLQDKDGNDLGSFCFVACSTDPDNICPQGYQCTELQDQNGAPAGSVCFRDCSTDPFG